MQNKKLKPVIKWAGGKTKLLSDISARYPKELGKTITKFAEPFIGGGAVLFDILSKYDMEEVYISDVNVGLINMYQVIKQDVNGLMKILKLYQKQYNILSIEKRKKYFYEQRDRFNSVANKDDIKYAALFIFLNKTCFNGLYRVNKKGVYNVPAGACNKPFAFDGDNLRKVSQSLHDADIVCADFKVSADFIDEHTFVYLDPPYKPLADKGFTDYSIGGFDDKKQKELAGFAKEMSDKGAFVLLSNSDPKSIDVNDTFFEDIYEGFKIEQVFAPRMINSDGSNRGNVSELLIHNYL